MPHTATVEAEVWGDMRFDVLAQLLGETRYSAVGRMTALWGVCTLRCVYVLDPVEVAMYLGIDPGDVERILCTRALLGEATPEGIRIRGTLGRIEWLHERRAKAKAGGKARAASASRSLGGKFVSQTMLDQPESSQGTSAHQPGHQRSPARAPAITSPTATATATATATENKQGVEVSTQDTRSVQCSALVCTWIAANQKRRPKPTSAPYEKLGRVLARSKVTDEQIVAGLVLKAAEWRSSKNVKYWGKGETVWRKLPQAIQDAIGGAAPHDFQESTETTGGWAPPSSEAELMEAWRRENPGKEPNL